MNGQGLDLQLMKLVDRLENRPVPVAVWAGGMNPTDLDTLRDAASAGWMKPVLFGTDAILQKLIRGEDQVATLDLSSWETEEEALSAMIQLAVLGSVDVIAFPPGDPGTTWEMLANLDATPFHSDNASFGLSLVVPEQLSRPLFITDTVIHPEPGVQDRIALIPRLIKVLKQVGIAEPRIALLTAVEVASPGLPATMEAQEIAAAFDGSEGFYVQGPLSMDLAISEHAARKKKAQGEVPGKADLLATPNLTVARGVLQALTVLSDTPAATVVLGGPVPVAMPERADGSQGLVRGIALAAALSAH